MKLLSRLTLSIMLIWGAQSVSAIEAHSANLVARLRVDHVGVEIRRINTTTWVPIRAESLIGAGDSVRAATDGRATLTFESSLLSLQMFAGSQINLLSFTGSPNAFNLYIKMDSGHVSFRGIKKAGDQIVYQVHTPTIQIAIKEGTSDIRVEPNGRSSVVVNTGEVAVQVPDTQPIVVKAQSGVRKAVDEPLSDVVSATNFATLDVALDGCPGVVNFAGDVRLNVRLGPDVKFKWVGNIDNQAHVQAMGLTRPNNWFRIQFRGGYGWVQIHSLLTGPDCVGLRLYPATYGPEDLTLFKGLSEP